MRSSRWPCARSPTSEAMPSTRRRNRSSAPNVSGRLESTRSQTISICSVVSMATHHAALYPTTNRRQRRASTNQIENPKAEIRNPKSPPLPDALSQSAIGVPAGAGHLQSESPSRSSVLGARSTVHGARSTVHVLRSTVLGLRSSVHSPRSSVHVLRSTVLAPRSTVHGPRCTVHGPRCTVYGPRSTVHGSRFTVHVLRSSLHGLRSSLHGPRSTVHGPRSSVHGLRFTTQICNLKSPTPRSPPRTPPAPRQSIATTSRCCESPSAPHLRIREPTRHSTLRSSPGSAP